MKAFFSLYKVFLLMCMVVTTLSPVSAQEDRGFATNKYENVSPPLGSHISKEGMASFVYLPIDIGKIVNLTNVWEKYSGRRRMTVTGDVRGWIYLRDHLHDEDREFKWYYAIIVPPDIKPGTYKGELNYYYTLRKGKHFAGASTYGNFYAGITSTWRGPWTVPVTISVSGKSSDVSKGLDSTAEYYLDILLNTIQEKISSQKKYIEGGYQP